MLLVIVQRRAHCRRRVTSLALSVARWVHNSAMATFPEAPLSCGRPDFPGPVGSLGLSMVSLPLRDEGQALVRIRPNTHGWLTSSCHSYVGLPRLCVRAPRDH